MLLPQLPRVLAMPSVMSLQPLVLRGPTIHSLLPGTTSNPPCLVTSGTLCNGSAVEFGKLQSPTLSFPLLLQFWGDALEYTAPEPTSSSPSPGLSLGADLALDHLSFTYFPPPRRSCRSKTQAKHSPPFLRPLSGCRPFWMGAKQLRLRGIWCLCVDLEKGSLPQGM